MSHKQPKNNINKLADAVKQCQISTTPVATSSGTVLDKEIKPQLLAKWPKLTQEVPAIFLHKPIDFEQHVRKILSIGIKFYHPRLGRYYTKIVCHTFNDHKSMVQYFEKKQLPYHTFGHPRKRKMKIVIKGLPIDTELKKIQDELKAVSIPIIRVHKMHTNAVGKNQTMLLLAVVPYDEKGKRLLGLMKLLGHNVRLEPPISKVKQCYRCQKWGHSQRYCHGQLKCVKCAGDHSYKKCKKTEDIPPKCANCGEEHTASFRECSHCPESNEHKLTQLCKQMNKKKVSTTSELVTLDNCHKLYRNHHYDGKPSKSMEL